jgi:hypothetical protein
MPADEPESFALDATCVIVCPNPEVVKYDSRRQMMQDVA